MITARSRWWLPLSPVKTKLMRPAPHLEGLPQRCGLQALQHRPDQEVRQGATARDLYRRGDADAAPLGPWPRCGGRAERGCRHPSRWVVVRVAGCWRPGA